MNRLEFTEFYEENYRRVYNYISYRIDNRSDVEDLVSWVFTRALEKCSTYDKGRGTTTMWVIGIARNAVTDHYRYNAKRKRVDIETAVDGNVSSELKPEEQLIRREEKVRLLSALDTLSERERQVIALKYGAELSNREIAHQLGLGISNIGVILFRSLRKLRNHLEKEVRL